MSVVYLGVGSNIGDKEANCREALKRLEDIGDTRVTKVSALYPTKAVGGPPQEDYINGVARLETDMTPEKCLDALKSIEDGMGREPADKDHPRLIDLDILLYDDLVLSTDKLKIPHPRMHRRYFVLRGLAEIAPFVMHPLTGKTAEELYEDITVTAGYI